jgi:hypothetical protein
MNMRVSPRQKLLSAAHDPQGFRSENLRWPQKVQIAFASSPSYYSHISIMADEVYDGAIGIDLGENQTSFNSLNQC